MIKKQTFLILTIFLLSSCANTIERLSNIGETPDLKRLDPPVRWADNYDEDVANKTANSLWQPGSRTFFRDIKARRVGDILKVKINIKNKAKLKNKTATSRGSKEDMEMEGLFGLQTQLKKVIPNPVGAALVGLSGSNKHTGTGDIDRDEDINTEVSAMVVQILPNGNLIIKGSQEIRINNEVREITVTGIVQPADISGQNTIDADQIAEARISYGGRGKLSDVQQPRWGNQVLDILLPW